MKRRIPWIAFFCLLSLRPDAQQNLFNIPSGDITPRNKHFFQQQVNFNEPTRFSAKSHFAYGLGRDWELGVNLVNSYFNLREKPTLALSSPFNSAEPYPYYPLLLVTAQKRWKLGRWFFANLGTQAGTNLYRHIGGKRPTHFSYGLLGAADPKHRWKFLAGPYLTNWRFVGGGNRAGFLAGTEIHLSKRWLLMADHISGRHKNSVTVAGFTYNVKPGFQLCLGWQFPNSRSPEKPALVLEVNLFNF